MHGECLKISIVIGQAKDKERDRDRNNTTDKARDRDRDSQTERFEFRAESDQGQLLLRTMAQVLPFSEHVCIIAEAP